MIKLMILIFLISINFNGFSCIGMKRAWQSRQARLEENYYYETKYFDQLVIKLYAINYLN